MNLSKKRKNPPRQDDFFMRSRRIFRLQKINLLLTSTLWSPWLSAASWTDPYYLTTLPSTFFPPFSQLQAAPTTLDHRYNCTICDINLLQSAGFGGKKKKKGPQCIFQPQQSWWAKNNQNDFHSLFMFWEGLDYYTVYRWRVAVCYSGRQVQVCAPTRSLECC